MQDIFTEKIQKHTLLLQGFDKRHKQLGWGKMVVAVALLLWIFTGAAVAPVLFYPMLFLLSGLFLFLWLQQLKAEDGLTYHKAMAEVYQRYADRISGKWRDFPEDGEAYMDQLEHHGYAADLDIAGKNSLYQRLNTCGTEYGRDLFIEKLLHPCTGREEIIACQDAVNELGGDLDFAAELQVQAMKAAGKKGEGTKSFIGKLKDPAGFAVPAGTELLVNLFPVVSILLLAAGFILKEVVLFQTGSYLVLGQTVIWVLGTVSVVKNIGSVSSARYRFSGFVQIFELLEAREFSAAKLRDIQGRMKIAGVNTAQAIKELNRIIEMVNARNNVFVYLLFNIFLLWDYRCCILLYKWISKYGEGIEESFFALGEAEALLSFANMNYIEEETCFPDILEEGLEVAAIELGHPLIDAASRVCNSFRLDHEIFIVSGSNMSGKTTFLRTIGVNMVLALNGGRVTGGKFKAPVVKICTSMRVRDDLSEGISTFYAELSRIKAIVSDAASGEPIIFLIDEIFKGTNSVDRITGAKAVIEKLKDLGAIGMITTHDLELTSLADKEGIRNYSFSEFYEQGRIRFDYVLKSGPSTTTNARYLMQMVGLIE